MTDLLVLDLVDKGLVTDQIELNIGYDTENLTDEARRKKYAGPVAADITAGLCRSRPRHGEYRPEDLIREAYP
jgi:DNA polymerase V